MLTTSWRKAYDVKQDPKFGIIWTLLNKYLELDYKTPNADTKEINIMLTIDGKEYDVCDFFNYYIKLLDDYGKAQAKDIIKDKMQDVMSKVSSLSDELDYCLNMVIGRTSFDGEKDD